MGFFLEVLIGGLLAGVLYSLVALGFVLIFKASGVFNFAQGAMVLTAALALVRALELLEAMALAVRPGAGRRLRSSPPRHGGGRLGRRAAGAAQAGEPGRHHPVHGDDRRHLLPRRPGADRVRRRRLSAQYRPAQGADLHPRIAVRRRHPGERARHLGRRRSPACWSPGWRCSSSAPRIGRALRAVADDHAAAQSVGIPLNQIWFIVWLVAGLVALVAGAVWGSKLGVQFSLSLLALKALPVLILGGFTSVPGAIIGGLIIGAGEKLAEVFLGPSMGGGIEIWFAYVRGAAVPAVPAAGPVRRTHHRARVRRGGVIYREAGQYKASYAADQAIFPIAQDRIAMLALLAIAFVVVPLLASEYVYRAVLIPVVILALAAIGLNVLMGYCGQVSLGSGAFMGVGAYAAYNLAIRLPFLNPLRLRPAGRLRRGGGRHRCSACPSLRIKGFYLAVRHAGRAVLRRLGVPAHQMDHQLHAVGLGQRAAARSCSASISPRRPRTTWCALAFTLVLGARRQEHRARPYRPAVDGDPRHGHRRRDHRRAADVRQAHRLRRVARS